MAVLRKLLGVFLLLLALYIGCAYLMILPGSIDKLSAEHGAAKQGAIFGTIFFGLVIAVLLYFITRKGLKLLKKTKPASEIDPIGP